jgi:uncharacterized protein (TIGR02996 family)
MSTADIQNLEQARQHARRTSCGGCGKAGTLSAYEVQKDGPNRGRFFVKCRHCGQFDWLTAAVTPDWPLEQLQERAGPCPKCGKGRRAQRVSKDGPNHGRLFLRCADPACDSFEWASPASTPRPDAAPRPTPTDARRTEEGLLEHIRDHPEDDIVRLVYADWLEEHDQPQRAELIRVLVEHGRRAADNPGRSVLWERAGAILAAHEAEWTAALRPLVLSYRIGRGLIDEVEVELRRFTENGEELLRLAPAAALRVPITGWKDVKELVRCRWLLRVRRLTLPGGRMGGAGARILAESPHIANLKELSLPDQSLGQPGTQALAGSRYVAGLEVLDLSDNNLARSAVPLLASSPYLPRLRRLVLASNLLGDSDVRALANSPHLQELRELDLSGNEITNEGVEALAASPLLARLRRLDVSCNQVSQRGVSLLRYSPLASPELVVRGGGR